MKYLRTIFLGGLLLGSATAFATPQIAIGVQWRGDNDDRQAFQDGFRRGQWDAQHGRSFDADDNRWREGDDRRAFREGYARGYREVSGNYGGGGYSGGYNYGADSARRFGFEDGLNDGRRDRYTGHSFRPTHDESYQHADRGYNRSFGSKGYYKQVYRESYERGYREGYNGGGGWRR